MPKKAHLSDKSITNYANFNRKNTLKCTSFFKFLFLFFQKNVHYISIFLSTSNNTPYLFSKILIAELYTSSKIFLSSTTSFVH